MSNDKRTVDNEQPNNISDFLENYAGEQWFFAILWFRHGATLRIRPIHRERKVGIFDF